MIKLTVYLIVKQTDYWSDTSVSTMSGFSASRSKGVWGEGVEEREDTERSDITTD